MSFRPHLGIREGACIAASGEDSIIASLGGGGGAGGGNNTSTGWCVSSCNQLAVWIPILQGELGCRTTADLI